MGYRRDLNIAAVVQCAGAHGKYISIFAATHDTESGKRLRIEELRDVLRHSDDSQLSNPGLFYYAQEMPRESCVAGRTRANTKVLTLEFAMVH